MADKDYSQLTSATTAADTDLLAIYPTGGPLKKLEFQTFKSLVITALGSSYLTVANNLSDVNSASSVRSNIGLGTAAVLSASSIFQVANNLSEVANAATARTNIGAAAASAAQLTGGVTQSGSTKQTVQALAAADIDVSLQDFFTKSISSNTTFTISNATASTAQAIALKLIVSASAVPTWPATVKWAGGSAPTFANGTHLIGLVTFDGGTTWLGLVGGKLFA